MFTVLTRATAAQLCLKNRAAAAVSASPLVASASASRLVRPFSVSAAAFGPMEDRIRSKLNEALAPESLEITNDSALHAGHAAMRAPGAATGETHFTVQVVSNKFDGLRAIQRHRLVNAALEDEFKQGLHALIIKAKSPSEVAKE